MVGESGKSAVEISKLAQRAFLIPFHELTKIIANKIGTVLSFVVIKFFSIGFQYRIWITGRSASQLPKGIFVESKLVRPLETSLPLPFSRNAGLVTCLFYEVAAGGVVALGSRRPNLT